MPSALASICSAWRRSTAKTGLILLPAPSRSVGVFDAHTPDRFCSSARSHKQADLVMRVGGAIPPSRGQTRTRKHAMTSQIHRRAAVKSNRRTRRRLALPRACSCQICTIRKDRHARQVHHSSTPSPAAIGSDTFAQRHRARGGAPRGAACRRGTCRSDTPNSAGRARPFGPGDQLALDPDGAAYRMRGDHIGRWAVSKRRPGTPCPRLRRRRADW